MDRLRKIARLEVQKGFRDTAVFGGLGPFLQTWVEDSPPEAARRVAGEKLMQVAAKYTGLSPNERSRFLRAFLDAVGLADVFEKPEAPTSPKKARAATIRPQALALDSPLIALRGIGRSAAAKFEKLGIRTAGDLLHHYPHRYNDFSRIETVAGVHVGEECTLLVTVWQVAARPAAKGRQMSEAVLRDDSGAIRATWFTPYPARSLKRGQRLAVSGRVTMFRGMRILEHPEYETIQGEDLVHTGRLVPVYPSTDGVYQKTIRNVVRQVLRVLPPLVEDPLPNTVREGAGLLDLESALRQIHFPESWEVEKAARQRLAFDELFALHVGMLLRRSEWRQRSDANAFSVDADRVKAFVSALPFPLTAAQRRVLDEVSHDLQQPTAMSRLVQGEVGSGKTVIAAGALYLAFVNGLQGAMMAPTEILAEQHAQSLSALFQGLDDSPSIELVTGSLPKKRRKAIREAVATGDVDIVVGTDAVIQQDMEFANISVVIVDEQHRFGVMQRGALRAKGQQAHMLVMTATPIPRSLALTLYGDLDLSLIDEMPPGRKPIRTRWLSSDSRASAYRFIEKELDAGHQAFIIYPLVEESAVLDARSAVEEAERLATEVFPNRSVGLLHGRLSSAEKADAMRAFKNHETDILVSTAVVEVGVDVSNATVMMIEDADRFGLAQLHQFRGRVGRGDAAAYCMLISDAEAENAFQRLSALEKSSNGLELAETDLRLRGPGDFIGTRQSGLPMMKLASVTEMDLVQRSRAAAESLFNQDPDLSLRRHEPLRRLVERLWADRATDVS